MKSRIIRPLTKYIVITIIQSITFLPWNIFLAFSNEKTFHMLNNFQTYGDYFVKIMTVIFIVIDFKKEKLPYMILACISSLFYPFLGMMIFALLFLEKESKPADKSSL